MAHLAMHKTLRVKATRAALDLHAMRTESIVTWLVYTPRMRSQQKSSHHTVLLMRTQGHGLFADTGNTQSMAAERAGQLKLLRARLPPPRAGHFQNEMRATGRLEESKI